jgi:F-type H+/Na+-transporting ATPase subunit alpha
MNFMANVKAAVNRTEYNVFKNIGVVTSVADGIVSIIGISSAAYGEMVNIITAEGTIVCLVLNIESRKVGAIVLGNDMFVKMGQYVISSGTLMSVPTGEALLGRIVDPLGNPLDEKGPILSRGNRMVEIIAPSIISRTPVNLPLETGLKVVDSIIPIGHGQRELIIGDSKTGKTSIAIDTILNQKKTDTISIYVSIGQKRSSVARIAKVLAKNNCLNQL